MFYIIKKQIKLLKMKLFYFKIFQHNSKTGLSPLWRTLKKPFDVIGCLYKMKQSHWLLCVAKYCDWSRKITSQCQTWLKSLLVEWKLTYSESRIEPQNVKIWKKMPESKVKSVFVLRAALWAETFAWTLLWILQEFKRIRSENLWLRSTVRVFNILSVSDSGNSCPLWFGIHKSVWYSDERSDVSMFRSRHQSV